MEEKNNPLIVEMVDDEGAKLKVEIVSHFEDGGKLYVIAYDLENDTDSYIFELVSTPEGDELVSIDSDEEFDRLCKIVDELEAEDEDDDEEEETEE